jgi:hypothetical protein
MQKAQILSFGGYVQPSLVVKFLAPVGSFFYNAPAFLSNGSSMTRLSYWISFYE